MEEQAAAWEKIKASEKELPLKILSVLDGVPRTLPALMRAYKLQRRASKSWL